MQRASKTVITPLRRKEIIFAFKSIWQYRELVYFLVWRNIKIRYKQAVIGVLWVVLQPIITALIFSIIFGRFLKLSSEGAPYIIFFFCAFLPWSLFANSVGKAGEGLILNRNLITKIYFPRILIPISINLENLIDFCISCVIFFIFLLAYKVTFTMRMLALPFFIFLALIITTGMGCLLSGLNVKYRDIRYVTPFLIQIWFYCSPVVYSSGVIPNKWQLLFALNPLVGIINGFRWSLLGSAENLGATLPLSLVCSFFIFFWGVYYFYKNETTLTDII